VKCVLPLGGHEDQSPIDYLARGETHIEVLHAADADTFHPREIRGDSLFGNVTVDPMPPHAWARAAGRTCEIGGQDIWIAALHRLRRIQQMSCA
jgi:hypothetical protein